MEGQPVPLAIGGSFPKLLADDRKLILAASLGTVFEWYDFFLYGSLATTISRQFFSGVDENTGFLFALLAFATGFLVRPFGAALFGRLGDRIGRKHTFLMTMVLMGVATVSVGLLPGFAQIGIVAPVLLVGLRLLQGLALGGEYGGAAVYVAEQAPADQRGYHTGWIQATATLGMVLSLAVILCCRLATGPAFDSWGWRIPFWFSFVLLGVSVWIRVSMKESRAFLRAKDEGKLSRAPLREVFGTWENVRKVLVAFGGLVAGMTVIWYTSTFYALFFLTQSLHVAPAAANYLLGGALLLGTPCYILAGRLSDRLGRKRVMLTGMLASALTLMPIFKGLTHFANPELESASLRNPVVVAADPLTCGFQFDPIGKRKNSSDCDRAKALLSKAGIPYSNVRLPGGAGVEVRVGAAGTLQGFDADAIQRLLAVGGYPSQASPERINAVMVIVLLFALVVLASLIYGPLAAALVEMFPTRIRYTALSVPYHAGVGWIGGLLPAIAFSLVVATGGAYDGLWFPITIVTVSFVVGACFVEESRGRDLDAL